MRFRWIAFGVVVSVIGGFGSTSCASRPRPSLEKFSDNARVAAGDFPDARAVILLDRTEVTYYPPKESPDVIAEVVSTRRTQVVDERGLDQATLLVPFDDRSRILSITSRVIHA